MKKQKDKEELRGESAVNTLVIVPYSEHRTRYEGSRHKLHLARADIAEDGALCGFEHPLFGEGGLQIDEEWLNQPQTDELCKHCKKKAKKLLAL